MSKIIMTNLRRARLERGWRQWQVAGRAHIRQPLLSDLENAKLLPGAELRARLAKILRVPEAWLFEDVMKSPDRGN